MLELDYPIESYRSEQIQLSSDTTKDETAIDQVRFMAWSPAETQTMKIAERLIDNPQINEAERGFSSVSKEQARDLLQGDGNNLPKIAYKFHQKAQERLIEQERQEQSKPQIYVSANGGRGNGNPGSKENPYSSIQQAINSASGRGVVINVLPGTYNERIRISGKDITIKSDPANPAILDLSRSRGGGNAGILIESGAQNVRVSGFEIKNLSGVKSGVLIEGRNINNVTVDNMNVHHGQSAEGISVYGTGSSDQDAVKNVKLISNQVHNLKLKQLEAMPINGNVDGIIVAGNIGHNNDNLFIDFIGGEGVGKSRSVDQARNGVIEYNFVHGATSTKNPSYGYSASAGGIYSDAGKDLIIRYNYVMDSDFGIELGSEHGGFKSSNIQVYGNIFSGSKLAWVTYGGPGSGGTVGAVVKDNLVIGNSKIDKQNNSSGNDVSNANNKLAGSLNQVDSMPSALLKINDSSRPRQNPSEGQGIPTSDNRQDRRPRQTKETAEQLPIPPVFF